MPSRLARRGSAARRAGTLGVPAWSPPAGWESYSTLLIDAPGTYTLNATTDYRVSAPSRIDGNVNLSGGRNIVWIGGHIYIPDTIPNVGGENYPDDGARRALDITGAQTDSARTIHLEGLLMNGPYLTEGVDINDKWRKATVQIVNCRIEDIHALTADDELEESHSDLIQPTGNYQELRIDGLTGSSSYQGLFMRVAHMNNTPDAFTGQASAGTKAGPCKMRRANVTMKNITTGGYTQTGHRGFMWYPAATEAAEGRGSNIQSAPNFFLDNGSVWLTHNPSYNASFGEAVYPSPTNNPNSNYAASTSSDSLGSYVTWPATATLVDASVCVRNWDDTAAGRIYSGSPPSGDFVPSGTAGLSYAGPWKSELAGSGNTPYLIGQSSNYLNNATLPVSKPAGTVDGDVMFAWINIAWNSTVSTVPSGWTLVGSVNQPSGPLGGTWLLYRKTASSEGNSYSWVMNQTQNHWGAIVSVRGAHQSSPVNAGGSPNTTVTATSHSITAITPTVSETLLLAFYSARNGTSGASAYTHPSGMTEYVDRSDNFSGIGIAYLNNPTASSTTGAKSVSVSPTSEWGGVLVAVAPD